MTSPCLDLTASFQRFGRCNNAWPFHTMEKTGVIQHWGFGLSRGRYLSAAIDTLQGINGGEGGIRTPGPLTVNGFQDRRIRPLCHLSVRPEVYKILTGLCASAANFRVRWQLFFHKHCLNPTGASDSGLNYAPQALLLRLPKLLIQLRFSRIESAKNTCDLL